MEINSQHFKYTSDNYKFQLVPIGDIHYGNWQCDTEYFEKLIDWVKHQENTYVIGMGDYCDCITPVDKRFDMDSTTEYRPAEQYDYIYRQFNKIQDKILGLHIGHHGDNLRQHQFDNHDLELSKKLGVRYLDWHAFTVLNFARNARRSKFVVYSCHGHGGGGTTGSKVNKIEDLSRFYEADIYLMGHLHKCLTTTDMMVGVASGKFGNKFSYPKRVYGLTGTMLRFPIEGKSGYEARKGYRPMKPGVIKVKIYPESHDIHISE